MDRLDWGACVHVSLGDVPAQKSVASGQAVEERMGCVAHVLFCEEQASSGVICFCV